MNKLKIYSTKRRRLSSNKEFYNTGLKVGKRIIVRRIFPHSRHVPVHRCINGAKIRSIKICISRWGQEARNLSTTARLTPMPAFPPVPVPVHLCILPYNNLIKIEVMNFTNTERLIEISRAS